MQWRSLAISTGAIALLSLGACVERDLISGTPAFTVTELRSEPGAFCEGFSPSGEQLRLFWDQKMPLTPEQWQAEYDWYPCSALGTVLDGGEVYQFEVNAGGSGYVWQHDGEKVLVGCEMCIDVFGAGE